MKLNPINLAIAFGLVILLIDYVEEESQEQIIKRLAIIGLVFSILFALKGDIAQLAKLK